MKLKFIFQALLLLLVAHAAQGESAMTIRSGGANGYIRRISNNGKWGVIEKSGTNEGSIIPGGGYIINLETLAVTDISHSSGLSGVADISDDGTIVVGEKLAVPSYYSTADNSWHDLALPAGALAGRLESVTPDGKYAVGYYVARKVDSDQDFDSYLPVLYDLTTGEVVPTPNMPIYDMQGEDHHMVMLSEISADGRYLVGRVSQSYLMPPGLFSFVYDRQTESFTPIGFTENDECRWTPDVPNTVFCDFPLLSADGKWIVGTAYMAEEVAGSEFGTEYKSVYRYNIASGKYECYNNGISEQNIDGVSILSDGTVTVSSPSDSPYADAFVRSGKYYVSLDQLLLQNYGTSFRDKTGWDNTGKLISISEDGKTMVTLVSPTQSYIINLPEPLQEAAAKVDLMSNYTISPTPNGVISKLKTINVKFDRNIEVLKSADKITFSAADGTVYSALSAVVTDDATTTLAITFRTRSLQDGMEYTLNIPAGMVSLKGDNAMQSKEITAKYKGRNDSPMKLVSVYPADGDEVAYIDGINNPVQLEFDVELEYTDESMAYLYREGEDQPFAPMNFSIGGTTMMLYPSARINFFKGNNYRLVIAPNSVTDVTGGCANEEISITWVGSYVREWSTDDKYLFNETCDNFDNFMFYDGDCRVPATEPAEWGFTQATPWYVTRDSQESSDMAFTTHSMYNPAGAADDWCVIPQIFIPDENCYLAFDAQSYLWDKTDILKVYVYEQEDGYSVLNDQIIEDIRTKGDLVFNEQLDPGETETLLANEWINYVVKLDKYAGKAIYIAFVNNNEDQSAIFVDNIQVVHDMHYLVTLENKGRVVNADDIAITGNITVASEVDNYKKMSLVLKDAQNNVVSTINEDDVNLSKGEVYTFEFPDKLPLSKGEINKYYIEVALDDVNMLLSGEVKNLMFEPYRRVVLEEYSGRDCGNCPLGFLAIENIESKYPGRLLPVLIRTYQGDPLGTSVSSYSDYLGMESVGAPSGRVDRGSVLSPAIRSNGELSFLGAPYNDVLWFDKFLSDIAEPAEAEISFTTQYDEASSTATVNTTVRNAISAANAGLNIFAVVVEDKVDAGYQSNYFANDDNPLLGDWGKGGKYGKTYAYPIAIDDVARATWGNTFQGTGGLIPSTVEAGKEYKNTLSIQLPSAISDPANCKVIVMLIDPIKGTVINANVAPMINGTSLATPSGVEGVNADGCDINIVALNSIVMCAGAEHAAAYSVDGRILGAASAKGGNSAMLNLEGYKGVAIVVAVDANGKAHSEKIVIK